MSRSHKRTPIFAHTTSTSEAADKAAWHRRHRHAERRALAETGVDYIPRSHHAHSSTWNMDKDGKHYWPDGIGTPRMRK